MINRIKELAAILLLVFIPLFAQDIDATSVADTSVADTSVADTSEVDEVGGREMYTSVDVSYLQDKGNTDFLSMYYGFDFTLLGDVGPLTDTEFSLGFNRSDDKFDGEPFTDDQYLTLKFDLWANQGLSPFLFFQNSFDKTIGLEDRLNYGLGAKVSGPFGLSISYAFLAESETYGVPAIGPISEIIVEDTSMSYWDFGNDDDGDGDSTFYALDTSYVTVDSSANFYRHSIRPKLKIKLMDGGLVFDYRFYYKPRVDDLKEFLLENELKISIATFYELLYIDLIYTRKYNTRYDPKINKNLEVANLFEAIDENITLGLSFSF